MYAETETRREIRTAVAVYRRQVIAARTADAIVPKWGPAPSLYERAKFRAAAAIVRGDFERGVAKWKRIETPPRESRAPSPPKSDDAVGPK